MIIQADSIEPAEINFCFPIRSESRDKFDSTEVSAFDFSEGESVYSESEIFKAISQDPITTENRSCAVGVCTLLPTLSDVCVRVIHIAQEGRDGELLGGSPCFHAGSADLGMNYLD